jgi:N6-adenosine-specific RNA methylase IME4
MWLIGPEPQPKNSLALPCAPYKQYLCFSRSVVEKRREHNRKPDCVRERIERLVAGPYLKLFSRETKQGWECRGNQVALFNNGVLFQRAVSPLGSSTDRA